MEKQMTKTVKLEHGHTVTFDDNKHVYIHNGEYVVGMSTLLGKLASPALEAWKVNTQVSSIKQEMEKQGIALDTIDKIIINARANARKANDNILSIGSIVHKLVELWLKGEKVTKPDNPVVANCFMEFQKFWKKHKLKVVESEKILYSERGYCGTLDLIAKDKENNIWLIDVKTSKGLFLNMVHQLHGYKLAYEEQTGKKINKMYIVRLPKTNEPFEARQILYKADHMKAFLGLLHCHKSELLFKEQMRKLKSTQTKRKKNVR
jgi:hypothetical protein|tara:strand:+ start:131 stop:919 length:789 start_codon:yes stop_codon:yes gene_type:complete